MYNKILFLLFVIIAIQGCSLIQPNATVLKNVDESTDVVVYPAALRGAYIFKKGKTVHVCAEPVPDVALENLQKLSANLNAKLTSGDEGGINVSSEISTKIIELAGRTELLLLTRELLYRVCELEGNRNIDSNAAEELYSRVMDLVLEIAAADKTQAEANLKETNLKQLELELKLEKAKMR